MMKETNLILYFIEDILKKENVHNKNKASNESKTRPSTVIHRVEK